MLRFLLFLALAGFGLLKAQAPISGVIFYVPFEDSSFADVQNPTALFTVQSNPGFAPGVLGSAGSFDGIDDNIVYNNLINGNMNQWTLSFWFNPDSYDMSGSYEGPICQGTDSPTVPDVPHFSYGIRHHIDTRQGFFARQDSSSNFLDLRVLPQAPLSTWTHAVITYDGFVYKQYINGQLVSYHVNCFDQIIAGNYEFFNIGHARGYFTQFNPILIDKGFFDGLIDEVYGFNYALSSQEVLNLIADTSYVNPCDTINGGGIGTLNNPENDLGSEKVSIHPNPFNNEVTVGVSTSEIGLIMFEIVDVTGRILETTNRALSGTGIQTKLQLGELPIGNYLIKISYPSGRVESHRVVRQ